MIVTKNWLNDWIDLGKISTQDICKTLNSIGLEVDSVDEIRIPKGVIVGYVKEKEAHPDAQKLSVCQVDIGNKTEQIVCGAKNVAKGQYIALATVGTVLPDGLKIKPAKLRGIESNGMICSSSELGLPKLNEGIMVLDESIGKLKVGKELSEYKLLNDDIIEIELTANRGDCLSIHGVARDLGVAFDKNIKKINTPEEDEKLLGIGRVLSLQAEENLHSSFVYKALEYKKAKENLLMELRLKIANLEYSTPLERIINYATYSTGVLIRTYNLECFKKGKQNHVVVKKDENGFECVFGNDKCISKIGFNQEKVCELDEQKNQFVIEASYIPPNIISQLGMENKKQNRDFHYYNSSRGSEPDLRFGLEYLSFLFSKEENVNLYGGEQSLIREIEPKVINIQIKSIEKIIGQHIERNLIVNTLKALGFEVNVKAEQDLMSVKVPAYRHDVAQKQDICEEIVRMVGIDNIASKPYVFAEKLRTNEALENFKKRYSLRVKSAAAGFFESVHYVFDDSEKMAKWGFKDIAAKSKRLANPITKELNTLRATLALHLLQAVSLNTKNNKKKIALFEIGKVFNQKREESTKISWIFSGETDEAHIFNHGKPEIINLKYFAKTISQILGDIELRKGESKYKLYNPYEYADIFIDGVCVGFLAKINAKAQKEFGIMPTYICEVDFHALPNDKKTAKAYAKFPTSSRDLSLLAPKNLEYKEIKKCIEKLNLQKLVNFYPIDRFESKELGDNVSLSISFVFQDENKTLEDEEVNAMIDKIVSTLDENIGIKLR